jgi:ATP-dependent DNA helicase RecG
MRLTDLNGLSEKRLIALNKEGIHSPADLMYLFPRRIIDRSNLLPINRLSGNGEEATVTGVIRSVDEAGYGRRKRLEAIIQDQTGMVKAVWFRGISYFKKSLHPGQVVALFGTVKRYGHYLSIAHPDLERLSDPDDSSEVATLVPVYPGSQELKKAYITSPLLQKWNLELLQHHRFHEFLPDEIRKRHRFPERQEALYMMHRPESMPAFFSALRRFKFEELFLFQLGLAHLHTQNQKRQDGIRINQAGEYTHRFFKEILPFELTEGQRSALSAIKTDLKSGYVMNRLLQGDVGAGKTIVAIGAMLMALDNGYQAAFMAPTEILADQHYRTLDKYLAMMDINVRLLVGNQKTSLRRDILTDISAGTCQITVGTHAIIQKEVQYARLGMAVVDEQHRFGVMQRAELQQKGKQPHLLVMSATPIPRSLAMTLYGDLDVSVIRELPAGRKPVRTAVRGESNRDDVYKFVSTVLQEGGQAYIVYPLVEESEALDLKDATMGYDHIREQFPQCQVGLLHGRMSSDEKDQVMRDFLANRIQILVTTTVIEVGVDVPNASLMIIEHAERFGLSQLHQLRGRIGRGSRQSYCILMADYKQSKEAKTRLKTMASTNDGFKIAEVDLQLRGPGDFLGTRQSGLPDFKVASIVEDQEVLAIAKEEAQRLMDSDPDLSHPEHQALKHAFEPYLKEKAMFFGIS